MTAYYSFNKSNNSGTTSGDVIYVGQEILSPAADAGVVENGKSEETTIFYNETTKALNLRYSNLGEKEVSVNLYDLNGRLVKTYELGVKSPGNHTDQLEIGKMDSDGLYIVSLKVGEDSYREKLYLK